jgi:GTP-binding protein LepA
LNLIDTPGHVDFTYEVSKSIAACEGVLLLVDAAQGVEAQTVANLYLAVEHNLVIIPVINKIDLSNADIEKVKKEIMDILGISAGEVILASAKQGVGTEAILERIIEKIPPPSGDALAPLQALIFDSTFDQYKGVLSYARIVNGTVHPRMKIQMMATKKTYEVQEIGVFKPKPEIVESLSAGEVGYIACNIREAKEVTTGDTITDAAKPAESPLPGYRKVQPLVFSGIYPEFNKDFQALREAMEKLRLSDASFVYEAENSASLGFGFRCGFLGLLHMEIVQERLEREYDLSLILTTPSVVYNIVKTNGEELRLDNPTKLPEPAEITSMREPFVRVFILTPNTCISTIMELCKSKRGKYVSTEYLEPDKIKIIFEMPLAEIIVDFYDKIKSITRGYGSLDYEFLDYRPTDLVKLDILINGEIIDAFSCVVYREKAYAKGKAVVTALKSAIPRHLFKIALQAAIGGNIIAREDVSALRKHVTGKCYGGDITRKRKLWEKQKAGKKRMKQFGRVSIPQEAFIAALKA